jgi:hypothetical protein
MKEGRAKQIWGRPAVGWTRKRSAHPRYSAPLSICAANLSSGGPATQRREAFRHQAACRPNASNPDPNAEKSFPLGTCFNFQASRFRAILSSAAWTIVSLESVCRS